MVSVFCVTVVRCFRRGTSACGALKVSCEINAGSCPCHAVVIAPMLAHSLAWGLNVGERGDGVFFV